MTKSLICPICEATNITSSKSSATAQLTLGPKFTYEKIIYHCNNCNEQGDFSGETDKNYLYAQKKAEADFIKDCIKKLKSADISMAYFERVFELPSRTLTRWKTGDFSASSLALLRIISTYPWITEVAEQQFISRAAKASLINASQELENLTIDSLAHYSPNTGTDAGTNAIFPIKTAA